MPKLVRDRILEIIRASGGKPRFYIADDNEYKQRLYAKLQEEVEEFLQDDNIEEMADILEVLHAICSWKKISLQQLEQARLGKYTDRGGFAEKIILE